MVMPLSMTRPSIWWNIGRVGGVDLVLAVHAAREPECGWAAADGLHGADLHRARLGAQEDVLVIRHVEGVAAVAGRVVLSAMLSLVKL